MKQKSILPDAVAIIKGSKSYPNIRGQVQFYQQSNYVLVRAAIQGLPSTDTGFFGFHIHEGNSCTGPDFADTRSHYNPAEAPHPSHAGDLPPIFGCDGYGFLVAMTDRFFVDEIIGKTIIIHSGVDDFMTQPSGNSGEKIACGEIGIVPQPRNMTYRI